MIVGWWLLGIVGRLRKRFLKAFSRVYRKRVAKSIRNFEREHRFVSGAAHAAVPGAGSVVETLSKLYPVWKGKEPGKLAV
jgi:hypothetical protein